MVILDGSSNSQATGAVPEFLVDTLSVQPGDISVDIAITAAEGNPNPANPNPANECSSANQRNLIEIKVTIPFNKVSLIPGNYLNDKPIVGRAAMRHEQAAANSADCRVWINRIY